MKSFHFSFLLFTLTSFAGIGFANAEPAPNMTTRCSAGAQPILTVTDFNGDGIVSESDIVILKSVLKKRQYYAFYDVNADGRLNQLDLVQAKQQLNTQSTIVDQQLARLFHQVKQFQIMDSKEEIAASGFRKFTPPLSGHGEHWTNQAAGLAILGLTNSNFYQAEGLNVSDATNRVHGLFWGQAAIPIFENGATDYPQPGGEWQTSRVIAFAGQPPKFTASHHETWHTHGGLCVTSKLTDEDEKFELNQHTTFAECQAIPSHVKSVLNPNNNIWVNIWMLHAWMFDLNPNGFFAGEHPCVDPLAPPEHTINGGRPVPEFFQHHGDHGT